MTASAQIGTLREVPDSASISLDFGASVKGTPTGARSKSNFRTVLEQYHASRENASQTRGNQRTIQQKRKDYDSTTTLAVPQQAAPAEEAPRLILPLNSSITLRQDATPLPDETATQSATTSSDEIGILDSTAADSNAVPAAIATTSPTPTILRGALSLYSLPRVNVAKTNRADGAQPNTLAKSQGKSEKESKDLVLSESAATEPASQTAPADPLIPIRVTSTTTLEQAATVVQNSSTVCDASSSVSTSTSERTIAYQYRSSSERLAEGAAGKRPSQKQQKISDPTPAVTVPIPVTNAMPPQPLASNAPRQDTKAPANGSAVRQDSSAASGADLKNALPPTVEQVDDTAAAPNAGAIAFAARLTPAAETLPPAPTAVSQAPAQVAVPVTAKQIAIGTDVPADAHSGESGGQPSKEKSSDLFAKSETLVPQMHVPVADHPAVPANNHASTSPLSSAAHMDQVIDPPAAAPKTNNDITVRIPDSTNQGMAVRFVERAGEVHVSVRTGDAEMAQSLRGGLNDLVNHLEDGGIRTEVWQPGSGSNATYSHNDSHQPFADPDGSNGRQYSGSHSEQESQQESKPRWVEELEGSIGNPNFKETTQLLWQA